MAEVRRLTEEELEARDAAWRERERQLTESVRSLTDAELAARTEAVALPAARKALPSYRSAKRVADQPLVVSRPAKQQKRDEDDAPKKKPKSMMAPAAARVQVSVTQRHYDTVIRPAFERMLTKHIATLQPSDMTAAMLSRDIYWSARLAWIQQFFEASQTCSATTVSERDENGRLNRWPVLALHWAGHYVVKRVKTLQSKRDDHDDEKLPQFQALYPLLRRFDGLDRSQSQTVRRCLTTMFDDRDIACVVATSKHFIYTGDVTPRYAFPWAAFNRAANHPCMPHRASTLAATAIRVLQSYTKAGCMSVPWPADRAAWTAYVKHWHGILMGPDWASHLEFDLPKAVKDTLVCNLDDLTPGQRKRKLVSDALKELALWGDLVRRVHGPDGWADHGKVLDSEQLCRVLATLTSALGVAPTWNKKLSRLEGLVYYKSLREPPAVITSALDKLGVRGLYIEKRPLEKRVGAAGVLASPDKTDYVIYGTTDIASFSIHLRKSVLVIMYAGDNDRAACACCPLVRACFSDDCKAKGAWQQHFTKWKRVIDKIPCMFKDHVRGKDRVLLP